MKRQRHPRAPRAADLEQLGPDARRCHGHRQPPSSAGTGRDQAQEVGLQVLLARPQPRRRAPRPAPARWRPRRGASRPAYRPRSRPPWPRRTAYPAPAARGCTLRVAGRRPGRRRCTPAASASASSSSSSRPWWRMPIRVGEPGDLGQQVAGQQDRRCPARGRARAAASRISTTPAGSRPLVGSSRISNRGRCSSALARPSRCALPSDSVRARRSAYGAQTKAVDGLARRRAAVRERRRRRATSRFSRTVSSGYADGVSTR